MSAKGADFSEFQPKNVRGQLGGGLDPLTGLQASSPTIGFTELPLTALGLDLGTIFQVTPNNSFRLGQQIFFYLGVYYPPVGQTYISKLRLKPWWARQNMEFRQAFGSPGGEYNVAGPATGLPVDREVFGLGPGNGLPNNHYVWVPSPKRLDVTPFDTPPPSVPPARHSDSLLLDDLWTLELQDPANVQFKVLFFPPQVPSRWASILYPAMGYALGFTYEIEIEGQKPEFPLRVWVSLQWSTGTFGGDSRIQESIG